MRRQSDDHSRSHLADGSTTGSDYTEATGRRRSSDQGVVLTADTDKFIIGQRVWVGGHRPGQIAFIGETHFAPGDWAGIVLDDFSGKNDGCVSGKRYFQCEPKRGIFSKLTRLTSEPLPGLSSPSDTMNNSMRSVSSPARSGTASPTHSVRSYASKTPSKSNMAVGDRVIVSSGMGSRAGILKFIGETKFAPGNWCGVQLDEPTGKNDGSVDGEQYFECPSNYGIFVPVAKVSLSPLSRKSRLSRSGSKESLTSVGTIGSVASTATSRLRMSAQDLLREKQNHVEQLILERDLTRQQTESDTLVFQKTINQLRERVTILEKFLSEEQRKAEDLQFSMDEATFCGDELTNQNVDKILSVQTEEYKERISVLEKQLTDLGAGKQVEVGTVSNEEIARLQQQLAQKDIELKTIHTEREQLSANLLKLQEEKDELVKNTEIQISSLGVSENCLREEINYLQSQNEELKNELTRKDEVTENEYLNMKHIENELKEELTFVQNELKIKEASLSDNDGELKKLIAEKDATIADQKEKISKLADEHEAAAIEKDEQIKSEIGKVTEANEKLVKIQSEHENSKKEVERHLSTIQEQKTSNAESKVHETKLTEVNTKLAQIQNEYSTLKDKTLVEKDAHIAKLSQDIEELTKRIVELTDAKSMLNDDVSVKNEIITQHEFKIGELQNSFDLERELCNDFRQQIDDLNLCAQRNENDFEKDVGEKEKEIENLKAKIEEQVKQNSTLNDDLSAKNEIIAQHEVKIGELQNSFDLERELCNDFRQQIDDINHCAQRNESDFEKDVGEKEKEIESLRAKIENQVKHNAELKSEKEKLVAELTEARKKQEGSEASLASLKQQISEGDKARGNNEETIESLNDEIAKLNKKFVEEAKENAEFKAKLAELQSALKASDETIEQKVAQLKESQQKMTQLEGQIEQKKSDLEKTNKATEEITLKLQTTEATLTEQNNKLAKLEVDYADLQRKQTVTEEKCEQLAAEKTSLQQNLDTLQSSSSNTNSEIVRLSDELKVKQKAHDELVDSSNNTKLSLEKRLHECQQNLSARTSQWERLKDEMESLTTQKIDRENELNLELSKIKEAYENEVESLKNEIVALKQLFKDEKERILQNAQDNGSQAEGLRNELKTTIDNLENTIKNLNKEVGDGKKDLENKEKKFAETLNSLKENESKIKNELQTAKKNEEVLQKKIVDLENSMSTSKATIETVTKEKNQVEETLKKAEIDAKTTAECLRSENQQLTQENTKLVDEIKKLSETFRETEDEQVDLVNKNLEYKKQIVDLNEQLKELESTRDLVKTQEVTLTEQMAQIESLQQQIDLRTKENSDGNEEKAKVIATFELKLKEFQAKLNESEELLKVSESRLKTKEDDFDKYKIDAEQAKTEIENLIKSTVNESNEKDKVIKILEDKINQLTTSVNLSDDLKNELKDKSEELKVKESSINELNGLVSNLKKQVDEKEENLKRVVNEKELEIKRSLDELQVKANEILRLDDQLKTVEKTVNEQAGQIAAHVQKQAELDKKNMDLKKKLGETTDLLEKLGTETKVKMDELSQSSSNQSTEVTKLRSEISELEASKTREAEELTLKLWDSEAKVKEQTDHISKLLEQHKQNEELAETQRTFKTRETELLLANKKLEGEIITLKASLREKDQQLLLATTSSKSPKPADFLADGEPSAQITFLNSIIADMQNKNEALKAQIQSADIFKNPIFDMPVKRKPAPRLFCDICDVFDEHDTEDCPIQSSDSPTHQAEPNDGNKNDKSAPKKRVVPPPRKYCVSCEVFGHEEGECDIEETY